MDGFSNPSLFFPFLLYFSEKKRILDPGSDGLFEQGVKKKISNENVILEVELNAFLEKKIGYGMASLENSKSSSIQWKKILMFGGFGLVISGLIYYIYRSRSVAHSKPKKPYSSRTKGPFKKPVRKKEDFNPNPDPDSDKPFDPNPSDDPQEEPTPKPEPQRPCPPGTQRCSKNGECVDLKSSNQSCGMCGRRCPKGWSCVTTQNSDGSEFTNCYDTQNDNNMCGDGVNRKKCPKGTVCVKGKCEDL